MTNFPDYLTEEQKQFWSNLDELQIADYPDSQIYSVTFAPSKSDIEYSVMMFFRYSPEHRWAYTWANEDGNRTEGPYIVRKPKEVPYTIEDILGISNDWFRAKGTHTLHKLTWVNILTLCVGLSEHGGVSIDKLAKDYIHSPNGKDWQSLTKKV